MLVLLPVPQLHALALEVLIDKHRRRQRYYEFNVNDVMRRFYVTDGFGLHKLEMSQGVLRPCMASVLPHFAAIFPISLERAAG